ncbi:hypothetical protein GCM10022393_09340 [Aquimarina addita]|uniref:CHAT domain-containing protein n=2 Tax=Aquimarina addita TaxID=870485 RepID=A0ABP7XCJ1_9FLAO
MNQWYQRYLTHQYQNKDSATFYFDKIFDLAKTKQQIGNVLGILNYQTITNSYHFDLENLRVNIKRMDSVISNTNQIDTVTYIDAYRNALLSAKGNYYYKINDYPRSKLILESILDKIAQGNDADSHFNQVTKINTLDNLATIAIKTQKKDRALEIFNAILNIIERNPEAFAEQKVSYNLKFSKSLTEFGDYEASKKIQHTLIDNLKGYSSEKSSNFIKSNYQNLIRNYLLQDSIDIALRYIEESKQFYNKEDPFEKQLDLLIGDVYLKKGDVEKAVRYYKKSLSSFKTYRNNKKHEDIASVYVKLANLERQRSNFSESFLYYQKALQQLSPQFTNNTITENPDPFTVSSKIELVKILREKLNGLLEGYKKKKNDEWLKASLDTSYDLITGLDALKPEFESKVDKQFLLTQMYPSFNSMIEIAYQCYVNTQDEKYIRDAFYFMEKSKSILLLEATRSSQAFEFGNVPSTIIDKERQYRATIIHLEKQQFGKKENTAISNAIFKVKNEYYQFIKDLEQQYPKYYKLKYKTDVIDVPEIQTKINGHRAIVTYHATLNSLYSITISKNDIKFNRVVFDQLLRDEITSFYQQLSNPKLNQIKELNTLSLHLYHRVLQQPLEGLNVDKLTIIADDVLNYIPFDVLSFSKQPYDYLVKKYDISYANSVTLLSEASNTVSKKGKLIAFAPTFNGSLTTAPAIAERGDFGPLLYNTEEVTNITKYFDGSAFVGNEASIASLDTYMKESTIIHFATHAVANDESPDYSYLAFASDTTALDLLYVKDVYGYTIHTDMVTLSACQTGIGKLQKGEGMLSLARGFNYAGAKSLVMTLWKINDQTTAELMDYFYSGLSEGKSKDKALHDAKLEYLNATEDDFLKHPYYWSGFVISGDMTPLTSNSFSLWWLLVLIIPVLLVFIKIWKKN